MKSLIAHVVEAVRGNPVQDAYDRVQQAQKVLAHRISDAHFHYEMTNFYNNRSECFDPHTHWNEFADAKQKWHDHMQDMVYAERRVEEARATLDARLNQLHELEQGQ